MAAVAAAAMIGLAPLPAAAEDSVDIEITDIDPVHTPGEPLPVSLTVTNSGRPLQDVPLDLTTQVSVPLHRSTVTSWLSDESITTQMLTLERLTVDLPRGETTIDIEVPAEALTWGNTTLSWGPRGVEASITVDGSSVVDRTLLTTEPSFDLEPMGFTAIVPLTISFEELSQVPTSLARYEESMEALGAGELAADEELPDPVVDAVQAATTRIISDVETFTSPGVTLALDSSFAAPDYGTVDMTAEVLSDFADDDGHELILLPALDADMSAWAATGEDRFFREHADQAGRSRDALAQRDVESRSDVLFSPGPVTQELASLSLSNGADVLVVSESDVPPTVPLNWTPSAHARLNDGQTDAVIVDDELSALLEGDDDLSDLDRRQALVALTAIHYRERPNDPRPLAFAVSRGDERAASAEELNDLLAILDDTAWLEGLTLSDIEELPLDPFDREDLPSAQPFDGQMTEAVIDSIDESGTAIITIGDLTTHAHLFRDSVEATHRVIGSWSLTVEPGQLLDRAAALSELANSLLSALTVQSSSTINLISQASEFPVHITSTMPVPITVAVDARSDDRRLQFTPVSTVLQPNTTTTVRIPVKAIGSGNVSTQVDIVGPVGQVIGEGTDINIRVRADWENVGTAILAGLFLVILIVGVVRSARRGTRTPPVSEADILESED